MSTSENIIEIPALLQNKVRKRIVFESGGIILEKPGSLTRTIYIKAENISSFTFGMRWISGYCFNIGRQYTVNIQDHQGKTFSIKLTTYYLIKNKIFLTAWSAIIDQLWKNYFVNILYYYNDLYSIKQEFELCGVRFGQTGISWQNNNLLWGEIALNNYKNYFSIHHKNDTKNVKHCSFKNDQNGLILQHLLKSIVNEHQTNGTSKVK